MSRSRKTNHAAKSADSEKEIRKKGGSHVRKRKLRLDRIAAVVVPLVLIILLIGFLCLYSCEKNGRTTEEDSNAVSVATGVTETQTAEVSETTAPEVATDTTQTGGKSITLAAKGINKGNLILINNDHSYDFPNGDPKLVSVYENRNSAYSVSDMEVQLEEETVEQLNAMMADFVEETGLSGMQVFSGYRDKEDQDSRYDSGSTTFRGGYSDYHSGRSFNLKINFGDGTSDYYNAEKYPSYGWISEHAAEYGFVVRYPDGKDDKTGEESRTYTFRYVGVVHATYMTEHNLCLEEYIDLLHGYSVDDPLEITVEDKTYAVFYTEIGGTNDVNVTVPSENYTVSGDNMHGYIITCEMD